MIAEKQMYRRIVMNKVISTEEIMSLYKQCNIIPKDNQLIRTDINKGTLCNKLNNTFPSSNMSNIIFANNTIVETNDINNLLK